MTSRSCSYLFDLSFHFLSRAFTLLTVYREKDYGSSHAKSRRREEIWVIIIKESRIDANHVRYFRETNVKEKNGTTIERSEKEVSKKRRNMYLKHKKKTMW